MSTAALWPTLLSPEVERDPYAFYRELRAEDPIHWDTSVNAYLVSRHADVRHGYRHSAFSSDNYEVQLEPVFGRSLLQMSGAEHTRTRAVVSPPFRGTGLEKWTPAIMRNLDLILDGAVASATDRLVTPFRVGETVDLLGELGYLLPVYVISDMLGLPHGDYDRLFGWYTAHVNFLSNLGRDPEIDAAGREAREQLWSYLAPIIKARRAEPGDDLISALVTAEVDGESLSDVQISSHITQLLNAGSETTGRALASLFAHLLAERELFEQVRTTRDLLLPAISETLRISPPSQMNGRLLTEDVELGGVTMPAGSSVFLLIASANHDERRFDDPQRFNPSRTDLAHQKTFSASGEQFAFGDGRHFCLGARLARAEMLQAAGTLLDRFPDMRLADGERPTWHGLKMRSVRTLEVTL